MKTLNPRGASWEATMDIPRERRGRLPRAILFALGAVVLVAVAIMAFLSMIRGEKGLVVDRSTIVTDVVRRGALVRSISAAGTLVSENVRVVSAVEPGVVESVAVKPGTSIRRGDVLARLDNPDLTASVVDASSALQVARAQLTSAREQAKASDLTQQSALAGSQAQMEEDDTNAEALASLHHSGLVAEETFRVAQIKAAQSRRQVSIGRAQIVVASADQQARIAQAQAQVDQAAAALAAREAQVDALTVRASAAGVVQSVDVDPGVRVEAGTEMAKVADQHDLKAVLQVPESQVHDVFAGMQASIDTGNGVALGRVARIAPSAENGSVAVDVTFARPLPPGSRPDLNVDGTIELERIPNAISIARPAGASDDETIDLYRLDPNGSYATLVHVRLGRGSTDRVQILSGLAPGETAIVSDTSGYDGQSILRLR